MMPEHATLILKIRIQRFADVSYRVQVINEDQIFLDCTADPLTSPIASALTDVIATSVQRACEAALTDRSFEQEQHQQLFDDLLEHLTTKRSPPQ